MSEKKAKLQEIKVGKKTFLVSNNFKPTQQNEGQFLRLIKRLLFQEIRRK